MAETKRQMAEFKKIYDNPFFNAAITFLEPLPVGLVMTLISAGVLRRPIQGSRAPGAVNRGVSI